MFKMDWRDSVKRIGQRKSIDQSIRKHTITCLSKLALQLISNIIVYRMKLYYNY